ncbi:MAG: tyrosine-type recombinase/integrase [Amylibacter sp.]|nr:tyrosine-type recombinase/integrase [Amylibacter sp.]
MNHNIPFLTRTAKGGWYGYRRRVPKQLKHLFGDKAEIIKAFNTKNFDIAQIELRKMNVWFDEKVESFNYTRQVKGQLPFEQLRSVDKDLRDIGMHPDEMPVVNVNTKSADINEFLNDTLQVQLLQLQYQDDKITRAELAEKVAALNLEGRSLHKLKKFQAERRKLKEQLISKYTDHAKLDEHRIAGIGPVFERDGYEPPQLPWDEQDPAVMRYRIMNNEPVNPPPTWQNALDSYLRQNLRKNRNPETALKHKKATTSIAQKLARALPNIMETKLQDVEGHMIQSFAEQAWPNAPTRSKNLRILRAVWRSWDDHHPKQGVGFDPFTPFVKAANNKVSIEQAKRRSFTPDEFTHFIENLSLDTNAEVRLIGLIMAYCGAPTNEAAGLVRSDVKLKGKLPYIIFRNNTKRIMGKDRLERAVPLIDPLVSQLKEYLEPLEFGNDDLIFPALGKGTHASGERSKKLSRHIINKRRNDPRQLTPYSLRHTFIDRAGTVSSPLGFSEYIVGHKTSGSSQVHANYGTGIPPARLVQHLQETWAVKDWGLFEEYD